MACLAKKYGISIGWFYGTAGHGKGLIHAMSSFGCKSALQHDILATDTWFNSSAEILTFLKEHFKNDKNKEYHIINAEDTAVERCKKRKEHKLTDCRKTQLITVNAEGNFGMVLYHTSENDTVNLKFDNSDEQSRIY